ncbi:hypothetical protein GRI62_10480 [Erythrobacter arachoides]|uniref:DUF3035 domain-containing protein n=1 Tax=Aurantiacibacter arachoides TaxID=1850444 RepID=A0A845A4F1_9SPHN|nr:hypothetical protein [Aurantiacibacter arachoides]MXO94026.1 hypothetical protein [Aurantiacibacter arachoides]GGD44663.1 hypothetical protein GCM10011411_00400 [Aurantiacibacter arachoides]
MAHHLKTILLPAAILLLAGCGDDLASRNEAVFTTEGGGEAQIVLKPSRRSPSQAPSSQPTTGAGFGDDDSTEAEGSPEVEDATPEDLIDTAAGFDPSPMDDASGLAPEPEAEEDWGE